MGSRLWIQSVISLGLTILDLLDGNVTTPSPIDVREGLIESMRSNVYCYFTSYVFLIDTCHFGDADAGPPIHAKH